MEKITNIDIFQTYINMLTWRKEYNENYGNIRVKKPILSDEIESEILKNSGYLKPSNLSCALFYELMLKVLKSRVKDYKIDEDNKYIINEISKFATRDGIYKDQEDKGFIIMGGTGTGKTIISKAFVHILTTLFNIRMSFNPSYKYVEDFTKNKYDGFLNQLNTMKFIDDLGSENLYNDYGITTNVVLEFIYRAYDKHIRCFATTNLDPNSLKKFYGDRGYSRMIEMFNFFTLKGNDKRL